MLDLDETLVYYESKNELLKFRSGLQEFLEVASGLFELVLFTGSAKDYADKILIEIDPKAAYFQYRLYR